MVCVSFMLLSVFVWNWMRACLRSCTCTRVVCLRFCTCVSLALVTSCVNRAVQYEDGHSLGKPAADFDVTCNVADFIQSLKR